MLGVPAGEGLVGTVAGISPTRTIKALSEALSGIVLEERADGCHGFLHALAAQAVYDEIPGPERRRLHGRAARRSSPRLSPCRSRSSRTISRRRAAALASQAVGISDQ